MTTTITLKKLLHRKSWENCTSCPVAPASGSFIAADKFDVTNGARAFLMGNASTVYMYEGLEDAWVQLPGSGATGVFAAGACGEYRGIGAMGGVFTQTATAGTTTTITTNRTIVRAMDGQRIRVIAGTGVGYEGTVASNTLSTNAIITVTPASAVAFDATTQYQVYSGSLWFMNAGTAAVGFSVYDVATNTWTARSVTGLPTAWGTDAQLVSTMGSAASFATGTATAGAATTLTNGSKAWAANMWTNYQIRITAGTGKGQIRVIASNTPTVITVTAAWTVTPDATSVYSIEGNDDVFYLLGNNAVTLYKYTVSTNTWATITPAAARAGALGGGGTADWIDHVDAWADIETAVPHYSNTMFKQNGRYIYSFRGGNTSTLDVYDIVQNTWLSNIIYGNQAESFNTGSYSTDVDGSIYISKEVTGRIFRFDINSNRIIGLATNTTQVALGGSVLAGDKMFILPFTDGATTVNFLYCLRHSGADLTRMILI